MSALPLQQHDDYDTLPERTSDQAVSHPQPDIAYMGGTAEDIDRLHPAAFWGALVAGIGMWGLIIAGLVALFS